jgi:glycosyltransferase involved in cell wall biosynthesis
MKNIVVNATSLRTGGGLTILKQFISAIPENPEIQYIIFTDKSVKIDDLASNVKLIYEKTHSHLQRLLWDLVRLKKNLKKNNILPSATISLQNTNFLSGVNCPNYIYYHNPLPLSDHNWKFYTRRERSLWFYKNIYPIIVKFFLNSQTEIFVQLNFIKEQFSQKYNFPKERIHVIFPNIDNSRTNSYYDTRIDPLAFSLFFPSSNVLFKNHQILFKAIQLLDKKIERKVSIYFTVDQKDFSYPHNLKNIKLFFMGTIAYSHVQWMYSQVNALLFPSFIETLGLPLIEAASHGLPILAADLPYSKEVLEGYSGVVYVDHKDPELWAEEILKLSFRVKKNNNYTYNKALKQWPDFFKIVTDKL